MTLLKINNGNAELKKSSTTKGQTEKIKEYPKDSYENSYKISDKFEVSETSIDETITKKKETV